MLFVEVETKLKHRVLNYSCLHLQPSVGTSGTLSLYHVMLGLGKPLRASHDATCEDNHIDKYLLY